MTTSIPTKIKTFIAEFWPSMLVFGVIMYATLNSDPIGADDLPAIPHIDKLIHAIMMGGFVGAIAFDIQRHDKSRNMLTPRLMWTIFACICAFSVLDEILQKLMENGRGCDPIDFCADIVGAAAAVYLAPVAIRKVLRLRF